MSLHGHAGCPKIADDDGTVLGSTCRRSSQKEVHAPGYSPGCLVSLVVRPVRTLPWPSAFRKDVLLKVERLDTNKRAKVEQEPCRHVPTCLQFTTHSCGRAVLICKPSRRIPSYHLAGEPLARWQAMKQVLCRLSPPFLTLLISTATCGNNQNARCGWNQSLRVMGNAEQLGTDLPP